MSDGAPVRFQRLEVQGFKSFAARTSFSFGPGITAIVGPNGSGKSNLADALRWVLGEQNPRALRLRRLEDVIFAGGGKRAQAGFAEVSMTLDNGDGWLPVEFSEVVVTRRLHRSGESEYLINRKRVRLRDVLDLFLKARLGQNSYAILGQGMVETVLSLRPEERRSLIEESADVRRHRLKIEEATDQLAATRDNRDRVELLLAEIAPRLAQLERQARRASEHGRLSRELAGALQIFHTLRLRSARVLVERSQVDYARADERALEAANCLQAAEHHLAEFEQGLVEASGAERALQLNWRRSADDLHEAERGLQHTYDRLQLEAQRRQEMQRELAGLRAEVDALETEAPAEQEAAVNLEALDAQIEARQVALAQIGGQVDQVRSDLAVSQRGLDRAREARREADARVARLHGDVRRLQHEAERLHERRRTALARLKSWAADYRRERATLPEHERRLQSLRSALADATRQARSSATALAQAEGVRTTVAAQLEGEQRRLEMLQAEQESRRPTEDVVVALLDALRGAGPGRPRVLGILGGLLHVQMGLEVAVEAALADQLSGLVVRTEREALAAIGILRQIEAGRLTFFPLETQRAAHPLNVASEAGVLGVASRFVRCDDAHRDLFEALLGRIVIVEDFESARRVVQRGLGAAVTLDGTVLRPGGSVTGGAAKTDGYVFQAGHELQEREAAIAELAGSLADQSGRVEALRAQVQAAQKREAALNGSLADLGRQLEAVQASLAARRRRFEPLRGELEWIRSALIEHGERLETAVAAAARAQTPRDQRTAPDDASTAGAVEQARNQLESLLEEQRRLAADLAEQRGRRSALARERAALQALHESRRSARERTARLIAAREQILRALDDDRATAAADEDRWSGRLTALRPQTQALLDELEAARRQLRLLTEKQQPVRGAVSAARGRVATTERERLESELAAARAAEDLDHLREEAEVEGYAAPVDACAPAGAEDVIASPAPEELAAKIAALRARIRTLGAVNEEAEADYRESKERHEFLTVQVADLRQAESGLIEALEKLRQIVREQFRTTFQTVNAGFQQYFRTFFGGGQARLVLTEPEDYGESGVDIIAQPPGKRLQNLALLSGGERSMTAVALLFALLENNTAPFCVLDEVDAALDEANVGRFSAALAKLAERGQFLVVTHNRGTVQAADDIYGISMTGDGVSNVLSMRLTEAAPLLV